MYKYMKQTLDCILPTLFPNKDRSEISYPATVDNLDGFKVLKVNKGKKSAFLS